MTAGSARTRLMAVPGLAESEPCIVDLHRASDIQPTPIRWLWPGWLARGKLHILAGAPGVAKTTIAMHLAACITTG
ncbi:MAG: AAA family ATPase, partial [Gammaproteobacteria bacterium]|nr:AAA family ATPase [Gammaproteobacteria bacterium]